MATEHTRRILIIEDEAPIAEMVKVNLQAEGYEVVTSPTGGSGLAQQAERPADLIVLDMMLPDLSGFDVLRTLRRRQDKVPVLVLTARNSNEDRVLGLSYGADDYLGKPFSMIELSARIQAILRRSDSSSTNARVLKTGPFRIHLLTFAVQRGRQDLNLGLREFRILEVLISHPGRVFSRRELVNLAWEPEARPSPRTVDVHIASLRRKLGESATLSLIQTLEREGYRWLLPVTESR